MGLSGSGDGLRYAQASPVFFWRGAFPGLGCVFQAVSFWKTWKSARTREASLVIWTHMEVFRERELLIIKTHSERGKPHTHCGPLDRICSQNQGGAGPVLAADWFSYC